MGRRQRHSSREARRGRMRGRRRGRPGSPRSVDRGPPRGRDFRSLWPQAFTPGRRTGRGPPIPAPETEAFEELHPCGRCRPPRGGSSSPRRGMPEGGAFAFSIPSPLMSASRASCGGRGGRAGAFLQPPTLPPGPSPGGSRRISRETPRIQPTCPDGRLDPGWPAVDSLALRGIPLGNGKDDPGSAGEFPGNTQAENARVGSRTKRPRAKRDPLGSGSQRHRSKPSGSLARLPCPLTFAPASTTANNTANTTANNTANTTARRGFCPRPFTAPPCRGVWSPFSGSRARRGRFSRSRPEKPGRARSSLALRPPALVAASPATNNTVNSTANSIANSVVNSTARPAGWGSEPPGEARARPLSPRPPPPDPCGRFGHYCLHYC